MVRTYAVGTEGGVVRSDNHSGLWNILYPLGPPKNVWNDVMTDPNTSDKVFIVGQTGDITTNYGIQYSTDAGLTWNIPTGNWAISMHTEWLEVWVANSNTIWVVGTEGVVVVSNDGGLSFNQTTLFGLNAPQDVYYTAAIHALNDQVAIVAGSPNNLIGENFCYVWKTLDGGTTWNLLNGGTTLINDIINPGTGANNPTGKANGIWMSNDQQQIVVGTGYTQQLSTDGGLSFNYVGPEMIRSGEHLTWYPAYNTSNIFRHTGGFTIQINDSTDSGNSYTTTKGYSLGDPFKTLLAAHFYTETDGYFSDLGIIYHTTDGGINETVSFTFPDPSIVLHAIWTGPPYAPIYYQLTSCCDETNVIYANITGGVLIDGQTYLYAPQGNENSPEAGCFTITILPSEPQGTIIDIELFTELSLIEEGCTSDICLTYCNPCLCTRARIIVTKNNPPIEDIIIKVLDCNNQIVDYILPSSLEWGEYICGKYFDTTTAGYTVQLESTGNCSETIVDNVATYNCPTEQDNTYLLEDCNGILSDIITNFDLSDVVGQVITIKDENNNELEGCWSVTAIPFQNINEDVVLGVYKCYEKCEDCLPLPTEPYPVKPRTVDPNYTTGNCDPEIVEASFCKHGESEYKKVMNKKYGIKDCCPQDEDKIYMQYEKIKLLLITGTNPTPDPCSNDLIINEYFFGRNDGDVSVTLAYTDINGLTVTIVVPACTGDCEPIRFCAVRGTITLNAVSTYAGNESCDTTINCITNSNLVFVRPCIS